MPQLICIYCSQPFEPRPQVPGQSYCSSPNCQRARKRQWQRAKLQSDSDYRINQRAAQHAWSQRNQGYWRDYRDARPEHTQRNRELQRRRDQRGNDHFAKMDACIPKSGLYRITWHADFQIENSDSWIVEISPICQTCPCKMDVSRED